MGELVCYTPGRATRQLLPIDPADIRSRSAVGSSPFESLLLLLSGLCLPSPSNLSRPLLLLPLLAPPLVTGTMVAGKLVGLGLPLDESTEVGWPVGTSDTVTRGMKLVTTVSLIVALVSPATL